MSQENVEIVRRYADAFNRRDKDAFLALLDPQFEGIPPSEWPESAPVRGREAAWDFGLELEEPWQEGVGEITELIEAENDRAVIGIAGRRAGRRAALTSASSKPGPSSLSAGGGSSVWNGSWTEVRPSKPPECGCRR